MNDMFARLARGSKGMGIGASFLLAAGGLAYAASQSIFTGKPSQIIFKNNLQ